MIITYHGGGYVRASFGDMTLAFNPISKDSELKSMNAGADIVLISLAHPDYDGADQASRGERQPFVISGPGEYEVKDVRIRGFYSSSNFGDEGRGNTIYLAELEGMRLCHLGALATPELPADAKEALEDIDILFVPIGGSGVLDAAAANKIIVKLEPRLVVPVHFGEIEGAKQEALKQFLKEAGEESVKPIDKLTVKKKDLEGKEGEVTVVVS